MENENRAFFNSPVIHKNTPIKRLGLSRKRKSSGTLCNVSAKIKACSGEISDSPTQSEEFTTEDTQDAATDTNNRDRPKINYDEEIEILKRKIAEDEEKLKTMKSNVNNINQLEDLIEVWKKGCKNAFMHFSQLLKDRQNENIDFRAVLNKLGVWETMVDNFESDSEISLSEYSQ